MREEKNSAAVEIRLIKLSNPVSTSAHALKGFFKARTPSRQACPVNAAAGVIKINIYFVLIMGSWKIANKLLAGIMYSHWEKIDDMRLIFSIRCYSISGRVVSTIRRNKKITMLFFFMKYRKPESLILFFSLFLALPFSLPSFLYFVQLDLQRLSIMPTRINVARRHVSAVQLDYST